MSRYTSLSAALAATLACSAFLATPASAIDTIKKWDGSSTISDFGCPNTTTYGQVITGPANKVNASLHHFGFVVENTGGGDAKVKVPGAPPTSMVVRGEVYAWDGAKATGDALFESKPQTISYSDSNFHNMIFYAKGVPLSAGAQYVIFATIDKDFGQCFNNYTLAFGEVDDTTYSGGSFVFQNNGGDPSQWTTAPWTVFPEDLAFHAGVKAEK